MNTNFNLLYFKRDTINILSLSLSTITTLFGICSIDYFDIPLGVGRFVIGIIGIIFILTIPGYMIIKLFRSLNTSSITRYLFAIGLSTSLLLMNGFILNYFSLQNLTESNILFFSIIEVTILGFIHFFTNFLKWDLSANSYENFADDNNSKLSKSFLISWIIIFVFLIFANILALLFVFYYNCPLLALIVLIITSIIVCYAIYQKELPDFVYIGIITITALSSLYQVVFYNFVGISTIDSLFIPKWDIQVSSNLNTSMYNVFLVPFFNMLFHGNEVSNLLSPLLFSLVPIALYLLMSQYTRKNIAFFSTFLFIAIPSFYMVMYTSPRDQLAQLFFLLFLLSIFDRKCSKVERSFFGIIFLISIIFTAYGYATLTLVYLVMGGCILIAINLYELLQKYFLNFLPIFRKLGRQSKKDNSTQISIYYFILIFIVSFFIWYYYSANASLFEGLSISFKNLFVNTVDTEFIGISSSVTSLEIGKVSFWGSIYRFLQIFLQICMVIGILDLYLWKRNKCNYLKEFIAFGLVGFIILTLALIEPKTAGLGYGRLYNFCVIFLVVPCIFGGGRIFSYAKNVIKLKKRGNTLSLITPQSTQNFQYSLLLFAVFIVIPFFLFSNGFVYEVAKLDVSGTVDIPWSFALSGYRIDIIGSATPKEDISGQHWLIQVHKPARIFGDTISLNLFNKPTLERVEARQIGPNFQSENKENYIFLRKWNNDHGEMGYQTMRWSATVQHIMIQNDPAISKALTDSNFIYFNGKTSVLNI